MKELKVIKMISIITYIFFIIQISLMVCTNMTVNATAADDLFSNMNSKVQEWESMGEGKLNDIGIDTTTLLHPVLQITQALTYIGFFAVIAAILFIAVKWQFSGKNPEMGERVRKQTVGLVIAAAILLGSTKLWSVLLEGLDQIAGA